MIPISWKIIHGIRNPALPWNKSGKIKSNGFNSKLILILKTPRWEKPKSQQDLKINLCSSIDEERVDEDVEEVEGKKDPKKDGKTW